MSENCLECKGRGENNQGKDGMHCVLSPPCRLNPRTKRGVENVRVAGGWHQICHKNPWKYTGVDNNTEKE